MTAGLSPHPFHANGSLMGPEVLRTLLAQMRPADLGIAPSGDAVLDPEPYLEHIPGKGIAIRLRKAFSSVVRHSDSRLSIELSAADSSRSFCAFSRGRLAFGCSPWSSGLAVALSIIFSRATLSAERIIAKSSKFAIIRVSVVLVESVFLRVSSQAFRAGPVRLPVPLKLPIASRALRPDLANETLRLGFSGVSFGACAMAEATIATMAIGILM